MKSSLSRWLPLFMWAAFIFILSSNQDPTGFFPNDTLQIIKTTRILGFRLENLVWAISHIFLYAVFAFLAARAMGYEHELSIQWLSAAFALTVLYGVSDEIHQIFVPERGFQYYDILMDGVGALIGLGVYALYRLNRAKRLDKKEEGGRL